MSEDQTYLLAAFVMLLFSPISMSVLWRAQLKQFESLIAGVSAELGLAPKKPSPAQWVRGMVLGPGRQGRRLEGELEGMPVRVVPEPRSPQLGVASDVMLAAGLLALPAGLVFWLLGGSALALVIAVAVFEGCVASAHGVRGMAARVELEPGIEAGAALARGASLADAPGQDRALLSWWEAAHRAQLSGVEVAGGALSLRFPLGNEGGAMVAQSRQLVAAMAAARGRSREERLRSMVRTDPEEAFRIRALSLLEEELPEAELRTLLEELWAAGGGPRLRLAVGVRLARFDRKAVMGALPGLLADGAIPEAERGAARARVQETLPALGGQLALVREDEAGGLAVVTDQGGLAVTE